MGARERRRSREKRSSAPGVSTRRAATWLLACGIALVCVGCNIFSWTHDEGGSDDPETLLGDAEAALLRRDYDDALRFAEKGIANDPGLQVPRLRYVASQAVLARSRISISDYFSVFTNQKARAKASGSPENGPSGAGRSSPGDRMRSNHLLDLSLEELRAIASACPQAVAYLRELIEGLQDGSITSADLAGARFDVDAGFAVGSLLTAFVTILDIDQNLNNGFDQHPDVRIVADDAGGYDVEYTGTQPRDEFISCVLVCPLWSRPPDSVPGFASICEALEGVYDAYLTAKGQSTTVDIGCTDTSMGPKPANIDTDIIVGQMLDFVYDGVRQLFDRYGPCPCAGGGA